jgi:hypothetical protein
MWLRGLSEIMVANPVLAARQFVIARSVSDEAIQSGDPDWIASLPLAMTNRSRGAPERPSYAKPRSKIVTTRLGPVVHAKMPQQDAGGSIRKHRFGMDARVKPGHDGWQERTKNVGSRTPTEAKSSSAAP